MSDHDELIRSEVRKRYAAIADDGDCGCSPASGGCCESESLGLHLYGSAVISGVPMELVSESLGCGDSVTIAGLNTGETVLDLGSGAGLDCFLAAQQVGESGRVIGVDMTLEMIEKARSNQLKVGIQNVEFRLGQIESLPVENESVDVIMSNCVINLSPDKAAVFREAYRVLKPGGRISVSDIVTEGEFSDEHRSDLENWAACVSGAIELSDYTGLIEQVGFQDLIVHSLESAGDSLPIKTGMPRVLQARITARKE